MKALPFFVSLLCLCVSIVSVGAQSFQGDPGGGYTATGQAEAPTQTEAEDKAKVQAVLSLAKGLNRDKLFADLFLRAPPVSAVFAIVKSEKAGSGFRAVISVSVDDESIRILYESVYLSTVVNLLDKTEIKTAEIERLIAAAKEDEVNARLGESMSRYWQAQDLCDEALMLIGPIGDTAIFSTRGKKKAPELRELIQALRQTAVKGLDRIQNAESSLSQDSEMANIADLVETVIADSEKASAYLESIDDVLAQVETQSVERLKTVRAELEAQMKAIAASKLILDRNYPLVPEDKAHLKNKMDYAFQRLAKNRASLQAAYDLVDLEIRDPAAQRAQRAQNIRWIFLHEPMDFLAFRAYIPYGLAIEGETPEFEYTGQFDAIVRAEGAFGDDGGLWLKTILSRSDTILASSLPDAIKTNTAYSQSVDLGFYGKLLFGLGFRWDWMRSIGSDADDKVFQIRAMLGGMDLEGPKNTWLILLSYDLPQASDGFVTPNVFNAGLDLQARLASILVLEGSISHRAVRSLADSLSLDAVFRWSVGAGLHLPPPFLWGFEYTGYFARAIDAGVIAEDGARASFFRAYLEYAF